MPPVAFEIDPTSENASNVPVVLTSSSLRLLEMDVTPAQIKPMFATSADTEGDIYVDSNWTNLTIALTLLAKDTTDALTQTAVNGVQQKIDKLRRDGGTLKFTSQAGTAAVADVLFAQYKPEFVKELYVINKAVKFTLEFTCKPFMRGTPVLLADHAETTLPVLVFTETGIAGDVPALGSLVIDNDQAAPSDQLTAIIGWQSTNYSSAATAALFYQAENLTALNGATAGAVTGASGTAVTLSAAWNAWVAMLSTQASGGGAQMTHIGTYRVFARCLLTSTQPAYMALEWGSGDLTNLTRNTPATLAGSASTAWNIVDLGLIHITPGTTSWQGRVIVKSTVGSSSAGVSVDWLMLVPVDEGSAVASVVAVPTQASAPSVYDTLESPTVTNGAVLTGRTGTSGGTWATGGSASAIDFTQANDAGILAVQRSVTSTVDSSARFATYGASITGAVDVTSTVQIAGGTTTWNGIVARWTDANNHLRFAITEHYLTRGIEKLILQSTVAGLVSKQKSLTIPESIDPRVLRLVVDTNGNAVGILTTNAGIVIAVVRLVDTALATGGAIANGTVGYYDMNATTSRVVSHYGPIYASNAASLDSVMYPTKSLTLTSSGATRTDRGSSNASPAMIEGDYLTVPQAGKESRTVRFIIKGSRGFIDDSGMPGDSAIDDISARLTVTPRFLLLPA